MTEQKLFYEDVKEGDTAPEFAHELTRTDLVMYAGASGDFNPIHIDEEFAKSVGLPGRILHGLWSMAQVARALTEAGGGPASLKRLSVQFRGMGVLEQEVVVSGTVASVEDGIAKVSAEARQGENRIVRNAEAELAA